MKKYTDDYIKKYIDEQIKDVGLEVAMQRSLEGRVEDGFDNKIKRKLTLLSGYSVSRFMKRLYERGHVIIPVNKKGNTKSENFEIFKQVTRYLWGIGYSYGFMYADFTKGDVDSIEITERESKEELAILKYNFDKAIIILNFDRDGYEKDFDELNKIGLELCRKYDQNGYLSKAPHDNPKYINQDNKIIEEMSNEVDSFGDYIESYFTKFYQPDVYGIDNEYALNKVYTHGRARSLGGAYSIHYSNEWHILKSMPKVSEGGVIREV